MRTVIGHCIDCSREVLWDDDLGTCMLTCACDERDPNRCSDGAGKGMEIRGSKGSGTEGIKVHGPEKLGTLGRKP